MKTHQFPGIFLLLVFVFTACSKQADDAVTIAPAAEVAGTYRATSVEAEGRTTLFSNRHQINYTLVKTSDAQVRVLEKQTVDGTVVSDDDYGVVELRRSGQLILFYEGTLELGHYDKGVLHIAFLEEDANGRKVNKIYTAERQ